MNQNDECVNGVMKLSSYSDLINFPNQNDMYFFMVKVGYTIYNECIDIDLRCKYITSELNFIGEIESNFRKIAQYPLTNFQKNKRKANDNKTFH